MGLLTHKCAFIEKVSWWFISILLLNVPHIFTECSSTTKSNRMFFLQISWRFPLFVPCLHWRTLERPSAHQLTFGKDRRAIVLLSALSFLLKSLSSLLPFPLPLLSHSPFDSPSLCQFTACWVWLKLGESEVSKAIYEAVKQLRVRVKSEKAAKETQCQES